MSAFRFGAGVAALLLLAACEKAPPPPPYKPLATIKQLMAEVVEPAADVYWGAVGSVTDAHGTVETAPTTDDEWNAVRNAAMTVAESGNLMMMDPRARNHDEWMSLSRALVDAGERARAAAESKKAKAVFDAGADVYQACVNCHSIYLVGAKALPPRP
jgi:hypothetical protein